LFNWIVRERDNFGLIRRSERKPKLIYFSSSAVYPAELQTRQKNISLSEGLVSFDQSKFSLPEATYGFSKFFHWHIYCLQ
jgi:hypothetical protein